MMKKNLYLMLLLLPGLSLTSKAQTQCDTINMPVSATWSDTSYAATDAFGRKLGYINGTNGFGDSAKANFFDLTGSSYSYILGALVKFGKANTATPDNLSRLIYFRVYAADGNKTSPGTLIGTAQKTLGEVKADVDAGKNTVVVFQPSLALPANKKFFVSVDLQNFNWPENNFGPNDSIWVAGTADDEVKPNAAWGYDGRWRPFSQDWSNPNDLNNDLDVTLWIFPHVSNASAGCTLLPVNLMAFNAVKNNKDVELKWEISDEMNMRGYEVQKANNNSVFETIAFITALNSLKNQSYTTTDRNAFATSTSLQYRLKQIDGDGSVKYSRVIAMKADGSVTDIVFANPFTGALKLQVHLSTQKQIAINVFDMQGRLAASQKPAVYNASTNTIVVASAANLRPGTYLLQISSDNEQTVYKIIKQ